ncbi:MAG: zinc-ribbon domain containing protein [Verrucomicrobia bacterium]|nr:zinc-ribbon domain containing protein [Verrucomicrobiota bacterium]
MKRPERTRKARKLHVHLLVKEKFQPVNAARWSEASKRSTIFQMPPNKYGDIHYECVKCDRASVFSAVDQKLAYEERQVYIWQRRSLCGECWNERRRVERAIRDCRNRWRDEVVATARYGVPEKVVELAGAESKFRRATKPCCDRMLLKLIGAAN